jgi:hypothetical protein
MLRLHFIIWCALQFIVIARELPYSLVLSVQNKVDAVNKENKIAASKEYDIVCYQKIIHSRESDIRPFSVVLHTNTGRKPVEVDANGSFRVPLLPESETGQARLTHNLEKGALALTVGLRICRTFDTEQSGQKNVFAYCSEFAEGLEGIENIINTFSPIMPEIADLQFAIVGLTIPAATPRKGNVLIKKNDKVVSDVDLTQTGQYVMMFDKNDPKEHTIVWEKSKDKEGGHTKVDFLIKAGAEAKAAKNAIFIRKFKP